ncbi:MAG: hypothetical protein J6W94_06280 [Bacteroidales bacterium]|nr:hypothetical protein [Bacteroidales bacterium]
MKTSKTLLLITLAILAAACSSHKGDPLSELDGYVSARSVYMAAKTTQLEALARLAHSTQDPQRRYDLEMDIASRFFPFSFDSTQSYLKHCQELALNLKDNERYNKASIQLGHLYAKAGNYMEAYTLLYDQIDTTALSPALKQEYLYTVYDFSRDLAGNSGMVERLSIPDRKTYRDQLFRMVPKDSERWRILRMNEYVEQGKYSSADSLCRILLSGVKPEDHNYAIYAYELSDILYSTGNDRGRLEWLIKSAESDIMGAVKDYASLTMVAQIILPTDVERSFHYLRIAQEDAIFYNAKLRPWQISRFLLDVEGAYSARQEKTSGLLRILMIIMAALVAILTALAWSFIRRTRALSKLREELERSNTQLAMANITLNDQNRQISKADSVKEEYILSFLEDLSEQITTVRTEDNRFRNLLKQGKADQLLKELSISGRSEKVREDFYETFDRTFLGLYPDFVEQFNALIREEARVHPTKGRLTTELRVFALIRLGVDDSKKIAAMLDYSVSTIYNHKVAIKNASLGDRDTFEDRVRQIGK